MLRILFVIVQCGIARFLSAVRVFDVRASYLFPNLPWYKILSITASTAEQADGEKLHTHSLTQSLTQLIWCPRNRSAYASEFQLFTYLLQIK